MASAGTCRAANAPPRFWGVVDERRTSGDKWRRPPLTRERPGNNPHMLSCSHTPSQPSAVTRICRRGFSLVELLIVLLVFAILAAIAIPAYQSYALRSRRSDAINALNAVMLAQERYRSGQSSYASALSDLFGANATLAEHYQIALSGVGATAFTATATPKSSGIQQADQNCAQISISISSGQLSYTSKDSSGATSRGCWSK